MALTGYQAQVQSLLDDAGAVEYTLANLNIYINDARVQIAGASESLRTECNLGISRVIDRYAFSAVTGLDPGVAGILAVRMARLAISGGFNPIEIRPWEWFNSFCISSPTYNTRGTPTVCSQLLPGVNGALFFFPLPDGNYTVQLNGVGYPIPLLDDTTIEVLTTPWTESVQYYAAYLALMNAQRSADANAMFQRYVLFEERATQMTTATRLPRNYPGGGGARIAGHHMPITAPPPASGRGQQ